jgi:hypothetical protein
LGKLPCGIPHPPKMAVVGRGQPTLRKPRTSRGFSTAKRPVTAYGAGCNDCSAGKRDTFDFDGTGQRGRGKIVVSSKLRARQHAVDCRQHPSKRISPFKDATRGLDASQSRDPSPRDKVGCSLGAAGTANTRRAPLHSREVSGLGPQASRLLYRNSCSGPGNLPAATSSRYSVAAVWIIVFKSAYCLTNRGT